MSFNRERINARDHERGLDLDLGEGWEVEVTDVSTMFIKYRGVDVAAIWLPYEGERDKTAASITVPSAERVAEAAVRDEYGVGQIEYGVADETDVTLTPLIAAIDRAQ